jgi:ribose transport system permease protein
MATRSPESALETPSTTAPAPTGRPPFSKRLTSAMAFDKVGAVYVWIAIIIFFSIWVPDTFPRVDTAKQILNTNAITGLAALAITIPLAARVFDLSFAYVMTLTGVTVAQLMTGGMPLVPALLLGLGVGVAIGLINALVVVVAKIDSFIGTLATGSLILALITMVTHDNIVSGKELSGGFADIGQTDIGGVTLPVIYLALVAIAIWYLLEHTATGRRLYATGFNADASRLAGVAVNKLRFVSLVISGSLAGASGIVLASSLGSGSPTAGTPYLLPAFAAVFLGATQLKKGRFNAGGTIIAVLLLGTGTTGLALAAAPDWSQAMFVGVVLIAALAVTSIQRRTAVASGGPASQPGGTAGTDQPDVGTATPPTTED